MQIISWHSCQLFWDLFNKIGISLFFRSSLLPSPRRNAEPRHSLFMETPKSTTPSSTTCQWTYQIHYRKVSVVDISYVFAIEIAVLFLKLLWYVLMLSFQQALTSMASDLTEEMTLVASTVESPALHSPPPFTNRPPGPGLPMSAEFKKEGDSHSTTFPKRFKPPYS